MPALPAPVAVALLCALAAQTAPVGTPGPAPATRETSTPEIIITGSRIPRRNLTAVSPVTLVKGEEFKLQGATLTEDLINQLPQVTPDQGAFISNAASGTSTVNLRDLGASRTLVLVNGRRLLPGDPVYPAGDINSIPSTLIQRVEVLTGGASSVYGSDAVSGVINFILDTRIEGLRIDAQDSFYQHSSATSADVLQALTDAGISFPTHASVNGANRDINAAAGHAFFGDRAHVTIYGGYRKLTAITQSQRDYSACTVFADPSSSDVLFCGGSPVSAQGTFLTNFGRLRIGPNQTFVPGRTLFNFAPSNYFQRPGRRYTAGGFADFDVTKAFKPYAEVMFMDDRTVAQIAPSGDFGATTSINCDSPLLSAQQLSRVCFEGNFIGETPVFDDDGNLVRIEGSPRTFIDPLTGSPYLRGFLLTLRRNVEGGPRRDDRRHRDLRLLGGFKGDLTKGVSYDASYMASSVRLAEAYTNDVSVTRLNRAVDVVIDPASGQPACRSSLTGVDPACIPWNAFALGGVTADAAAYITLPASQRATVKQQIATATSTIALQEWGIRSPWADEGPALNLGVEYRKDSLDFRPDAAFQSGDLAGQGQPDIPFTGATKVKEVFGEARVPLLAHRFIEELVAEGGYRQSWHSDGASKFATSSYKIALDFSPVRGIRFRASRQRAVRAPNIQELFAPTFPSFFDVDPCAGISPRATQQQCAATGVSAAQYGNIIANPLEDFGGYQSIVGGNTGLGPETAKTRAVGVVFEPRFLPAFNLTVDWYDISLKGAIQEIGAQTIMNTCIATADPRFCSRIHRDSTGSLWLTPAGFIDDTNANIGGLRVRGVDASASYTRDLGRFGSANVEIIGSRLIRSVVDNGGLSTLYDCAGLYGFPCTYPLPKWRHTARLTWRPHGAPAISLHWRYVGRTSLAALGPQFPELRNDVSPLETRIRPQSYFDLTALMSVKRSYVLRFGVRNVFDRKPPLITSGNPACFGGAGPFCNGNTFPQLYDPLGRYIFAGVTVNFKPFD
jgi:outer membrane receptor protein involved in Fe transport